MNKKINSIQVIRAMAFIGIFLSHCSIGLFSRLGHMGAGIFFILSGFLMTYTYYDVNKLNQCGLVYNAKFAWGRIRKLYFLHIVTMLIAIPMKYYECDNEQKIFFARNTIKNIFYNVFLIQSWIPDVDVAFSLNSVSWYLSTCIIQYFAFPWIIKAIRKIKTDKTAIVLSIALYVCQAFYATQVKKIPWYEALGGWKFGAWAIYIFPLSRLVDFIIGCNLGYVYLNNRDKRRSNKKFTVFEAFAFGLLFFCIVIYSRSFIGERGWEFVTLWTIPSCLLIYLFCCNAGVISKIITNKITILIGNLSPITFLIHQIVIKCVFFVVSFALGSAFKKNPFTIFCAFVLSLVLAQIWTILTKRERRQLGSKRYE